MTIEQLRYAMELANHHSLQKTADLLHISKPGLSQAITQLENEIGVKIFKRSTNGSFLTNAGKELMPIIQAILFDHLKLIRRAENLKPDQKAATLRIGYVNIMFQTFIDQYLNFYDKKKIRIAFRQDSPQAIIRQVRDHQLDFGFVDIYSDMPAMVAGLDFEPLYKTQLQLFTLADNPLAAKKQLTIDDLRQQKFVLFDDPYNIQEFNHLQSLCGPLQIILKTSDGVTAFETMKKLGAMIVSIRWQLANSNLGYQDKLVAIPLDGYLDDTFTFGWVTNPRYPLKTAARKFIDGVNERLTRK